MKYLRHIPIFIVGILLVITSCGTSAAPPTTGDDIMTQQQLLNEVMVYIKEKHPDAAPFIRDNIQWTHASADKRIGYTRAIYTGESWTVTIGHAMTAEVIYDIRAVYKNEMIVWSGTIKDNTITEVDYSKK